MAKEDPIWEKDTLTKNEEKLAQVFIAFFNLYAVVATPIMLGNAIEFVTTTPGFFSELYKQLEVIQHTSSVVVTACGFVLIERQFDRLSKRILSKMDDSEREAFMQKWIPLISAIFVGAFHWYAESGAGGKGMGTPDMVDAIYGVVAIFPAYIALEYMRRQETSQ